MSEREVYEHVNNACINVYMLAFASMCCKSRYLPVTLTEARSRMLASYNIGIGHRDLT